MSQSHIRIRGARTHNLKNVSLDIPRDKFVVITGLSGSGKSSLAFDTLYAEGQRRYVESLSAYARQFLSQMEKPEVDSIEGLSPAIAIEQKSTSHNPRSTVGTITEIYDYLRLLYARAGTPYCPEHDLPMVAQTVSEMVDAVKSLEEGTALMLLAPVVRDRKGEFVELFDRGRSTSLHLFEHVHGDSRDRGPAMIDLIKTYEQAGLFLAPGELPDYLPVMLEFASTQTPQIARAFLGEMAHLLNAIFNALQQRKSPYASVLGALLELAGEQARAVKVEPDEAIDAAWEEPPVFDGCSSKGQGKAGQAQPITFVRNEASGLRASGAAHNGVSP